MTYELLPLLMGFVLISASILIALREPRWPLALPLALVCLCGGVFAWVVFILIIAL